MRDKNSPLHKSRILRSSSTAIVIGLIALIISSLLLALVFKERHTTANFSEQIDDDYTVHTVDNEYYGKVLAKDQQYVTSIIDYIDLKPSYSFKTDRNLNFTYKFKAVGNLVVYDKSNDKNVLFSKEYELLPETTEQASGSSEISIDKDLCVKYQDYDNYSSDYKKKFNITGDDNFIVSCTVDIEMDDPDTGDSVEHQFQTDFIIPMTENTIDITTDVKNDDLSGTLTFKNKNIEKVPFFSAIALGVIGLILLILGIIMKIKKHKSMSKYQKWLKKLYKEHGNYIINTVEKIDENNYEKVYVLNFEDLLCKARLTNKNILCLKDDQDGITEFSIVENGIIYKKIYKESDKEFS